LTTVASSAAFTTSAVRPGVGHGDDLGERLAPGRAASRVGALTATWLTAPVPLRRPCRWLPHDAQICGAVENTASSTSGSRGVASRWTSRPQSAHRGGRRSPARAGGPQTPGQAESPHGPGGRASDPVVSHRTGRWPVPAAQAPCPLGPRPASCPPQRPGAPRPPRPGPGQHRRPRPTNWPGRPDQPEGQMERVIARMGDPGHAWAANAPNTPAPPATLAFPLPVPPALCRARQRADWLDQVAHSCSPDVPASASGSSGSGRSGRFRRQRPGKPGVGRQAGIPRSASGTIRIRSSGTCPGQP